MTRRLSLIPYKVMKRKREENSRLTELYEFIDRLQPDITMTQPTIGMCVVPLQGIRLMDSRDHVLELFESCHAWATTVARVKRSVMQYWQRIHSIQLLADSTPLIETDAVVTVGERQGQPKRILTDGWLSVGRRYLMVEFLALDCNYLPADLLEAVSQGNTDPVKRIVDSGVNINTRILGAQSPLGVAANNGSLPMLSYLLSHPDTDTNDVDIDGNSFMQRMGRFLPQPIISVIAPRVDLHIQNRKGQNIIHLILGDQRNMWSTKGLHAILHAGSEALTLCVDEDGNVPSFSNAFQSGEVTRMVAIVHSAQRRARSDVATALLSCIDVRSLVNVIMGYYTSFSA